jgi:phosphate acetyltransferase
MSDEGFLPGIMSKAACVPKRIVFPEGTEERVLTATRGILEKGIAEVILVGDEEAIKNGLRQRRVPEGKVTVINPASSDMLESYTETFYQLRKHKGITEEQALEAMKSPNYFATMMVHKGEADGLVSGSTHTTADTVRPALQIIKTKRGSSVVSSFFFMVFPETTYLFADCAIVEEPTAEQLAEIALDTAHNAKAFGIPPLVALLSYSTKGSAKSPMTDKVVQATEIAGKKLSALYPDGSDIEIDGELQLDAAIVPKVAEKKAKGSKVAGRARVIIFPDLNSGNIGYKLVERLAGASAYGPILQGLAKPVNDLSRGCSAEDIVGITAITVLQAQGV